MKQFSITFIIFIMRINVYLIYASQFLRQFRFNIRHKSNKKYIVFDILSRFINNKSMLFEDHSKLNVLYDYVI